MFLQWRESSVTTLRRTAAGSPGSLWQHHTDSDTLYDLVIEGVVHKPHLEHVPTARVVKIFVGGHIVANVVAGLPASKERESVQHQADAMSIHLLYALRNEGGKKLIGMNFHLQYCTT